MRTRALISIAALLASFGVLAAEPKADVRVVIGRIEFNGVTVLTQKEIEPVLEIAPGELLERIKVVRTAQGIQQLYRSRGYEQVSIESRIVQRNKPVQNVLEFAVSEGKPTRVSQVEFVLKGEHESQADRAWPALRARMEQQFADVPGGVHDQIKIADLLRGLQEVLASLEYVGSRVLDPEVIKDTSPGGGDAARWVSLKFPVELGDRVSFGFRGNSFFSRGILSELVEEQRLLGLGRDYISVVARKIEDKYRSEGFARVSVRPYSYDQKQAQERHVTYEIVEGPKVHIESVEFDGNRQFTSDELRGQFNALGSALIRSSIYSEKDVQKAAESVIEWMKSKGYLSARLFTVNTVFPPLARSKVQGSKARLLIYLFEGDQTVVQSFTAHGNTVLSREEISELLRVRINEPLNLFALTEGVEALKAAYRDRGYLSARVVNEGGHDLVLYSHDDRLADIQVEMDEGPQYRVSAIDIEGLTHTQESVVRDELEFDVGEILEEHWVTESRTKLNRLGIFSSVDIRVLDDAEKPDHKRIRIVIEEAGRVVLEFGPGFRSDIGLRLFAQGTYSNAWGRNHTASLRFSTNARVVNRRFIEYQVRGNYLWPRIFLGETALRLSSSLERWQYISFNADSVNAVAMLERRLFRSFPLTASLGVSLEGVTQYGSASAIDNQSVRIGTLSPGLKLDLLDNSLAPTAGFYASGLFEWATPALFSQPGIAYTRFTFKSEGYVPLMSRRLVIAGSFKMGVERNADSSGIIPIFKQFSLGGVQTIRGFQEQEVNIQNVGLGGIATYVNYRLQVDIPLQGALRFGPFIDLGNLLVTGTSNALTSGAMTGSAGVLGLAIPLDTPITPQRFFFGEMVLAAGFGVRYLTPIGPFSLDWGFKLNAANLSNRIDISVGKIF